MAMVVARLEKRPTKVETPIATSEPDHAPPLPPLPAQFSHIFTSPPIVGAYEMPTPRMPMGVPQPRQKGNGQEEAGS